MTTPLPFSSDLHEELFCLFILQANSSTYRHFYNSGCVPYDRDAYISNTINEYELIYEDRSLAPKIFSNHTDAIGRLIFNAVTNVKIEYYIAEEE